MKDKWGGMYGPDEIMAVSGWWVLVEESTGRERVWGLAGKHPAADRAEAAELAEELAREHHPQHPYLARDREVYQIGDGSWLVEVKGAMTAYHFRITVARKA